MSRQIGDSVIGLGYGAMFERQIQQESGFAPDVVVGQRKSSAGAEGIAQLMPQYYPHVNRTDPAQSLHAGAQTMQQHLKTWGGDVRKALASYNAGPNRIRQLRKETEKRGLNPNVWFGNVERVVAERVGSETVTYVSNIYKYYVAYKLVLAQRQATQKARESIKSSQ